jgi:hypothetical protein
MTLMTIEQGRALYAEGRELLRQRVVALIAGLNAIQRADA